MFRPACSALVTQSDKVSTYNKPISPLVVQPGIKLLDQCIY